MKKFQTLNFGLKFVKCLINDKVPNPEAKLITDPTDLNPQTVFLKYIYGYSN
jgi:hypothetical protein